MRHQSVTKSYHALPSVKMHLLSINKGVLPSVTYALSCVTKELPSVTHAIPSVTMHYHRVAMPYQALPSVSRYHALPRVLSVTKRVLLTSVTKRYQVLPCVTMRYHAF